MMLTSRPAARPFTASRPSVRPSKVHAPMAPLRAAEPEAPAEAAAEPSPDTFEDDMQMGFRGRRGAGPEKGTELKHFLPLPKPAHLVFVKPTVAVVAGMASRSSVGVKMTAGEQQLERYVIEYYARSVK